MAPKTRHFVDNKKSTDGQKPTSESTEPARVRVTRARRLVKKKNTISENAHPNEDAAPVTGVKRTSAACAAISTRSSKRATTIQSQARKRPRKCQKLAPVNSSTASATAEATATALDCEQSTTANNSEQSIAESLQAFESRVRERQAFWKDVLEKELAETERNLHSISRLSFQYSKPYYSNFVRQAFNFLPSREYLEALKCPTPKPINGTVRNMIVSWMMFLHRCLPYQLSSQTLHLAVNLLDRFFNSVVCKKTTLTSSRLIYLEKKLQAIGTSCFFIASKLEDERALDVMDAVSLSSKGDPSNAMTTDDILNWEMSILQALDFQVNSPTTLDFLIVYLNAEPRLKQDPGLSPGSSNTLTGSASIGYKECAVYMSELALLHPDSVVIPSHVLAATTLCCAITYVDNKPRKVSNLPDQVLSWLKEERQNGCLKEAAGKIATMLDMRACKLGAFKVGDSNSGRYEEDAFVFGRRPTSSTQKHQLISLAYMINGSPQECLQHSLLD